MTARRMQVVSYLLPISNAIRNESDKRPIFFQFLPEVTGDSKEANYKTPGGGSLGRAEQFHVYESSSNKKLSIKAQFAATGDSVRNFEGSVAPYGGGRANAVWVQSQVKRLQALTEPIYNRDTVTDKTTFNAPPLVLFTYGLKYINVPVVVTSVGVENTSNTMIDGFGALPQVVDVTIQLTTNYPYGFVPGYLNTIKVFDERGNINPNQQNFSGTASNQGDPETILADRDLPEGFSVPNLTIEVV